MSLQDTVPNRSAIETVSLRLPHVPPAFEHTKPGGSDQEQFDAYDDAYSSEEGDQLLLTSRKRRQEAESREQKFDERDLLNLLQTLRKSKGHLVAARYLRDNVTPEEYERERQNALGGTLVASSYLQTLFNREPSLSNVRYERFVLPALAARLLVDDDPAQYEQWWTEMTLKYPFLEDIQRWHGRVKTDYLTPNQRAIFYDVLSHIAHCTYSAKDHSQLRKDLNDCRAHAHTLLERLGAVQTENKALLEQRSECERGHAHIDETIQSLEQEREQAEEERLRLEKTMENAEEGEEERAEKEGREDQEARQQKIIRISDLVARQEALQKRISLLKEEQETMKARESAVLETQMRCETQKKNLQKEIEALQARVNILTQEASAEGPQHASASTMWEQSVADQIRRAKTAEKRIVELEERLTAIQEQSFTCEQELEQIAQECDEQITREREQCAERFEKTLDEREKLYDIFESETSSEDDRARSAVLRSISQRLAELPEDSPQRARLLEPLDEQDRIFVERESEADVQSEKTQTATEQATGRARKDLDEISKALEAIDRQLAEAQTSQERDNLAADKQLLLTELEKFDAGK